MTVDAQRTGTFSFVAVTCAAMLCAFAPCRAQATRAQDFVDTVGLDVHVMYTDGGYAWLDDVQKALGYIGAIHLRDHTPNASAAAEERYSTLTTAGYRFDFVVNSDIPASIARLEVFLKSHPGSIDAIEGPNEVNNWPITYDGVSGHAGAIAFQHALYIAVKTSPILKGISVYNFTDNPPTAGDADFDNLHPYPKLGIQPLAVLKPILSLAALPMPGKLKVITEAGYNALPDPADWRGQDEWTAVDQHSQAILTLNLLLDSYALGASRTYLYQLLDAYRDPAKADADKHLGLFDYRYRPKPVADVIHNTILLLSDRDEAARRFTPRPLDVRWTGLPKTAATMVLEKADGEDVIVVWNEVPIWNREAKTAIAYRETTMRLDLRIKRNITVYDPVKSQFPVAVLTNAAFASLPLSNHPLLVFLSGP
ncbi:MAG: hypothetical protein P4L57_01620 [Rhizomicrobium sp.]|nr:hypothetical protein [Rhizomicrobium sp.]